MNINKFKFEFSIRGNFLFHENKVIPNLLSIQFKLVEVIGDAAQKIRDLEFQVLYSHQSVYQI